MLTLLGVALLEVFFWILRPGAGSELPVTALALFYIGWILGILRVAWWELSRRAGFVHHTAYLVAVIAIVNQNASHLLILRPIYTDKMMPALLGDYLVMSVIIFLPYGIMTPVLLDGWRLVERRWRPW